jgi:hypothetical protein
MKLSAETVNILQTSQDVNWIYLAEDKNNRNVSWGLHKKGCRVSCPETF